MSRATPIEAEIKAVAADLRALGVSWALVGGLAVSAQSEPRFTRDIDLAIAVDPEGAERLVFDLQQRGYRVEAIVEQQARGRMATARLATPRGGAVDLLFASSGIEDEVVDSATELEAVPGLFIPVARKGHLLALKVLARDDRHRPQDRQDIVALTRSIGTADEKLARKAIEQIQARGFARRRNLQRHLQRALDLQPERGSDGQKPRRPRRSKR